MLEQSIFIEALEKEDPAERAAFLDQACAGDSALRQRIERLLERHRQANSVLETPAPGLVATVDATVLECPGTVIGPYKLLEQLGEGGMGSVFLAEQSAPVRRMVALKIIKPGMDSSQVIGRFEAERQALALMDHPNIARVFDAGTVGPVCRTGPEEPVVDAEQGSARQAGPTGRPYFVMELVKGVPITKFCDARKLTPRQRLELFIPVCQAIQHAHQKGIIHRDIKPSNVLVALYDDLPLPKVIDFGVAKATGLQLTEQSLHTGFGTLVGTPEYMSPEQATLNNLDIDTRSDVYSLGVLLYELQVGSPPFDRQNLEKAGMLEFLRVIREDEPPRPSTRLSTADGLANLAAKRSTEPSKLSRLLRGEIHWIVMKALEKDRSRRYQTANGLAMDIQRYLADEPVLAGPPSAGYRLRKFVKRNKGPVVAAALLLLALLAGLGGRTWGLFRAEEAKEAETQRAKGEEEALAQAQQQRNRAQENEEALAQQLYALRINQAWRYWQEGRATQARDLLAQEIPGTSRPDLRGFEWHYLWQLCQGQRRPRFVLRRHTGDVYCVTYSPRGDLLASCSKDRTIRLWDAATGAHRCNLTGHTDEVNEVAWSPDGSTLASGSDDGTVRLWDVATERQRVQLAAFAKAQVNSVIFAPDGKRLYAAVDNGHVYRWELPGGRPLKDLHVSDVKIGQLAVSRDGRTLAVCGLHGWLFDLARETVICDVPGGANGAGGVALGHRMPLFAVTANAAAELWDYGGHKPARKSILTGHINALNGVCFSPDDLLLATAGREGVARLWDVATGELSTVFAGHNGMVWCVAFSPEVRSLATAGADGTIRIWDYLDRPERKTISYNPPVYPSPRVAFTADGNYLAGYDHNMIHRWDLATARVVKTIATPSPDGISTCAADASCFLATDGRGCLTLRSLPDGASKCVWRGPYEGPAAILPGGTGVITFFKPASGPAGLVLLDCRSGAARTLLPAAAEAALTLALSRDGKHLAAVTGQPKARKLVLVDLASGQPRILRDMPAGDYTLAFSPGDRLLAAALMDGSILLCHVATGEVDFCLVGHLGLARTLSFSPNGKTLASGGSDGTVKLWHVATGQLVLTLARYKPGQIDVVFSPDGRALATSGRVISGDGDEFVLWRGADIAANSKDAPDRRP
jgi:WD40 repeat protein/serine/threonine protein kinase